MEHTQLKMQTNSWLVFFSGLVVDSLHGVIASAGHSLWKYTPNDAVIYLRCGGASTAFTHTVEPVYIAPEVEVTSGNTADLSILVAKPIVNTTNGPVFAEPPAVLGTAPPAVGTNILQVGFSPQVGHALLRCPGRTTPPVMDAPEGAVYYRGGMLHHSAENFDAMSGGAVVDNGGVVHGLLSYGSPIGEAGWAVSANTLRAVLNSKLGLGLLPSGCGTW